MGENSIACLKCSHDEWTDHKEMSLVTGQVEGPEQQITVAVCAKCGWRQKLHDE